MITISQLNSIFEEEVLKASEAGLNIPEEVYSMHPTLSRAKSFLGQCVSNRRSGKITMIKISKYLLEYNDDKQLRETIAHELCHTVDPKDGHGYTFKRCASILNRKYGYHISRTASQDDSEVFRQVANIASPSTVFRVKCTGCGQLIERHRMCKIVRYPYLYTCGICHHNFERIK